MGWYEVFNFLHVATAVLWVGGGFGLLLAADILSRKRGPRQAMAVVDAVALMGPTFFVPVSALALVFGVAAAWFGPGFVELWVILGLIGFAATFLNGLLMIKPRAEEISALIAKEGPESPVIQPLAMSLMMIARFDYVMLFVVVADMVLKPSANDVWVLAAMAAVLLVSAVLIYGRALRRAPVPA